MTATENIFDKNERSRRNTSPLTVCWILYFLISNNSKSTAIWIAIKLGRAVYLRQESSHIDYEIK